MSPMSTQLGILALREYGELLPSAAPTTQLMFHGKI